MELNEVSREKPSYWMIWMDVGIFCRKVLGEDLGAKCSLCVIFERAGCSKVM